MAVPTITWYYYTGVSGSQVENAVGGTLDYGNVQAGYWSNMIALRAKVIGSTIHTIKFWLNDKVSTAGGSGNYPVDTDWEHTYSLQYAYANPADADSPVDPDTNDHKTASHTFPGSITRLAMPITDEPATKNITCQDRLDNKVGPSGSGGVEDYTDYIYLAVKPASDAPDGNIEGWSYRCSFLYP